MFKFLERKSAAPQREMKEVEPDLDVLEIEEKPKAEAPIEKEETPESKKEGEKLKELQAEIDKTFDILAESPETDIAKERQELMDAALRLREVREDRLASQEEVYEEMKEILASRLRQFTDEARQPKSKVDQDALRRAKIALMALREDHDRKRFSNKSVDFWELDTFGSYLYPGSGEKDIKADDLDRLVKAGMAKPLVRTSFYSYNKLKAVLPKSLIMAMCQEKEADKNHDYSIKNSLEKEGPQYDTEVAEHIIAKRQSKDCIMFNKRFSDQKTIEKALATSVPDEALNFLLRSDVSPEDWQRYLDIYTKHNVDFSIVNCRGAFNNSSFEVYNYHTKEIEEQIEINLNSSDGSKMDEQERDKRIGEMVRSGKLPIFMGVGYVWRGLPKYAKNNYEELKQGAIACGFEDIVLKHLKPEDQEDYARRIIDSGESYRLAALIKSNRSEIQLGEHVLGPDIMDGLIMSDFDRDLKGELKSFRDLNDSQAERLLDQDNVQAFIRHYDSFAVSREFLMSPKLQSEAMELLRSKLGGIYPNEAKDIATKVPLPSEQVDAAVIEYIRRDLFENDRIDWAAQIVSSFKHIKTRLDAPDIIGLAQTKAKECIYADNFVQIIDSFPFNKEFLDDPELISQANKLMRADFRSCDLKAESLDRADKRLKTLGQYMTIDPVIAELRGLADEVIKMPYGDTLKSKIYKMISESADPAAEAGMISSLCAEIDANKKLNADDMLRLAYIDRFMESGTPEEKAEFMDKIEADIHSLAKNEPASPELDPDYYKYLLHQVYPPRNYDSYKDIDIAENRTADLERFKFDRNGYSFKLSGVVGYKLREGERSDEKIINEYAGHVRAIKAIANEKDFDEFLSKNIMDGQAKTREGKILEYFRQNGYSLNTMNALLAYQLLNRYDEFEAGSSDRISQEGQQHRNYIMLDEMVNQYGDNMKETIKQVQAAVASGEDKELFVSQEDEKDRQRYQAVCDSILKDLSKLPQDKISDELIQKKVAKSIRNTFQTSDELKERAGYFASLFSADNYADFRAIWERSYDELFAVREESLISMDKIEKLQSQAYQTLQGEISKYEEIREVDEGRKGETKLKKEREIKGYFSKNKENSLARMVGDICLASYPEMLKNPNYFEFVLFDEDRDKCVGTTMLLDMPEPDGKHYLLYCPNPSVGLVSEVSAKKLYQMMTNRISTFAQENGFAGVLVNKLQGRSTNRTGLFQQSLEQSCLKENGQEIQVNLKQSHSLGGAYEYQNDLRYVWKEAK